MSFSIGYRTVRIKRIDDYNIKCENCGNYHQRFSIFQQYFHLMFIPIYPSSLKTIKCICVNCNDTLNHEKKKDYLSLIKTPIYLYTGTLVLIGMLLFGVLYTIINQKQKKELVNKPKIGDVYLIKRNDNELTAYYFFLKIESFKQDSMDVLHGALKYKGFVTTMSNKDYFVKDDAWKLSKSDLINYLDNGNISSVERNYGSNSRFNIER